MGIASRRAFVLVIAGAIASACTSLDGLAGGEEPALDDGGKPAKDAGGRSDGGIPADSGPITPGSRCDAAKPFEAPVLVTEFDPQADFVKGAVMSNDELEAFYLRYDSAKSDWILRHARRSSADAAWDAITDETIAPTPDAYLSLTAGGLKLYFWTIESNYKTTRASTADAFGTPAKFDVASGPGAHIVDADDTAYFSRYEGDAAIVSRIRRGTVTSYGFSTGSTYVPNVWVDGANDSRPVLNRSETAMYFSSNRPGGRGLADVWVSHRPTKQDEFGPGIHVRELSTDEFDAVTWVSDDECVVLLDRASHVYRARRPK